MECGSKILESYINSFDNIDDLKNAVKTILSVSNLEIENLSNENLNMREMKNCKNFSYLTEKYVGRLLTTICKNSDKCPCNMWSFNKGHQYIN